ncbi:MAG TPA: GH1 family beta-glucosidase [Gaiellaceae bacterium]|nr:GH1 family beta-glucosidase [Gaiellaceae bacterium]
MKTFPADFLWGVATSAYQIEGAVDADGRGPSIWDTYSHTPGTIDGGDTGDVACDHYRRWRDDVDLIAGLNVNAYRFSIAWPRLFPTGRGPLNRRGLDHYDRLLDALLERGIEPVVTLYHWDLPQALEDEGGWRNRDTVERFVEYAAACFDAYGDRVNWWLTINEPWIVGLLGYLHGLHAPGYRDDVLGEVTVFHHLLLAHGRAVQEYRRAGNCGRIGLAPNLSPHYPASDDPADAEVTRASDGYVNRWFLDAIYRGAYPEDMRRRYEELLGPLEFVRDGDLATIAEPTDYLGINYYSFRVMQAVPGDRPWPWRVVVPEHVEVTGGFTGGVAATEAGTPIAPWALTDLLVRVRDDYGAPPLMITENGAVFPEPLHDERRVRFLHDHVSALHDAIERGVPVVGYCHWSLMDNFEWKLGYAQRFGLVHVDYDTLERTVKDSGRYYARIAAANALVEREAGE